MLFNNGTNSLRLLSSELSDPLSKSVSKSSKSCVFCAQTHPYHRGNLWYEISLLTIRQRAAGSRGQPRKSQSYLYDSRHDGGLDSSRIYTTPGTNRLTMWVFASVSSEHFMTRCETRLSDTVQEATYLSWRWRHIRGSPTQTAQRRRSVCRQKKQWRSDKLCIHDHRFRFLYRCSKRLELCALKI